MFPGGSYIVGLVTTAENCWSKLSPCRQKGGRFPRHGADRLIQGRGIPCGAAELRDCQVHVLVSHERIMLGGPGACPWAGCHVRWAGGASVGRVSCQVGQGCVRGQGVMSGGLGVRPWARGASVGRVGGCRAYVDGETGGWWSFVIRSLRVCNCRDGSSRQPFPFVCWWPSSSEFCPRMTPGPESAVLCVLGASHGAEDSRLNLRKETRLPLATRESTIFTSLEEPLLDTKLETKWQNG